MPELTECVFCGLYDHDHKHDKPLFICCDCKEKSEQVQEIAIGEE